MLDTGAGGCENLGAGPRCCRTEAPLATKPTEEATVTEHDSTTTPTEPSTDTKSQHSRRAGDITSHDLDSDELALLGWLCDHDVDDGVCRRLVRKDLVQPCRAYRTAAPTYHGRRVWQQHLRETGGGDGR